jgi:hypothetical protein
MKGSPERFTIIDVKSIAHLKVKNQSQRRRRYGPYGFEVLG